MKRSLFSYSDVASRVAENLIGDVTSAKGRVASRQSISIVSRRGWELANVLLSEPSDES